MENEIRILSKELVHSLDDAGICAAVIIDENEPPGTDLRREKPQILASGRIAVVAVDHEHANIVRNHVGRVERKSCQWQTNILYMVRNDICHVRKIIPLGVERIRLESFEWIDAEDGHHLA